MARLSREESRERTRERLLVAARNVFARAGYGGASVDTIAEQAGYSKGAFYSNFETKEAIFLELLGQHMQSELTASAGLVAEGQGLSAAISAIADRYAGDQQDQDWCLLSVEFALHAARSSLFATHYARLYDRQYAGIAAIITDIAALADRRVEDPVRAAVAFVAFRQGLALDRSGPSPRLTQDQVAAALRRFMYGLMGMMGED